MNALGRPTELLRERYARFAERMVCTLSEPERRDVEAFDTWLYRGGGWRWLIYVVAGVSAAGCLFAWLWPQFSLGEAVVLFNVLALTLLLGALPAWFGYRKFEHKLGRFALAVPLLAVAGAILGAVVGSLIGGTPLITLLETGKWRAILTGGLVAGTTYAIITGLIAHLRIREHAAHTARLQAEREQTALARQLSESKLRLLQLQIEPHFLFNTLGAAQELAERGAPEAAPLLATLIRFLRAATTSLRDERTTVAAEAELASAYLTIIAARHPGRCDFTVRVAPDVRDARVPPGMLMTLVENAVKHGIERAPAGGSIAVDARRDGTPPRLQLRVADTGAGIADEPGQGVGLANVRERLALLHGNDAELVLEANEPRGFVAMIVMPAA